MKAQLEIIRDKYINREITAENALQEVLLLFGVSGSVCKCMYKEWIEKGDKMHCPNCDKVMVDYLQTDH